MAVFDNCSSVMIFNNLEIFLDDNFSAAATKIRNSSGVHTISKKGVAHGFGDSLFDASAFINVICYYYVIKNPTLFDVNRVYSGNGVECGCDVCIKECNVMSSFRELNNACVGSLQPLVECVHCKKNDYSFTTTSHDGKVCDEFAGCFSSFCYASAGKKTVKQMKEIIKRDKLVGEIRRMQHRLGFVSDRHAECLYKNYIKGANVDPTIFRCTTMAYGPDLSTLSGKAIKVNEG